MKVNAEIQQRISQSISQGERDGNDTCTDSSGCSLGSQDSQFISELEKQIQQGESTRISMDIQLENEMSNHMSEDKRETTKNDEFKQSNFYKLHVTGHALTTMNLDDQNIDFKTEVKKAEDIIDQLNPKDPIQLMLTSQILSTHLLYLTMMANANSKEHQHQQYNVNTAIKLSNLFVNQVNLLEKLKSDKQETIKDLHVHGGGQAVVGTINCFTGKHNEEN